MLNLQAGGFHASTAAEMEEFRSPDDCFRHFDGRQVGRWDGDDCRRFASALLRRPADALADDIFAEFGDNNGGVDAEAFGRLWRGVVDPLRRPSALVVVDVQNDFIDGSLALRRCPAAQEGADVIPVINGLVEKTRLFATVAFSMDCHPEDHVSFHDNLHLYPLADPRPREEIAVFDSVVFAHAPQGPPQTLWPRHCVAGTWGAQLHAGLAVPPGAALVRKGADRLAECYSAFGGLPLHGAARVFVCGLALDFCVGATALDALARGCPTVVVRDACRGTDLAKMEAVEAEVKARGGVFADAAEVEGLADGSDLREEFVRVLMRGERSNI